MRSGTLLGKTLRRLGVLQGGACISAVGRGQQAELFEAWLSVLGKSRKVSGSLVHVEIDRWIGR